VSQDAHVPTVDQIVELKASRALDERALRTLFLEGRTANGLVDRAVPRALMERVVELAELGPTSSNSLPMRVVFVESRDAKERLRPALSPGNLEKTMAAPVTAIIAADLRFYDNMPRTWPHRPEARANHAAPERAELTRQFALTNATLQGGYFILAARTVGLDAGPMGGFDKAKVDAEFFADGRLVSIFLVNLGYADDSKVLPRNPRLAFDEVARFL
jgi:3-hydroxypropanoate dehydrogenase